MNDRLGYMELIRKAKLGDKESLEKMVIENTGLVRSVVNKFAGRNYDLEDLYQVGCMALIKSIQKFDFSFGVQFSTYAVPTIIGEIKRYLRDDSMLHVSRSVKETAQKARLLNNKLSISLGRAPTISELANELKIDTEEIVTALTATEAPESIYASVSDDENIRLIDKIQDKSCETEEKIINQLALKELIEGLEERDKKIILLRYFKGKTQQSVAKHFGVSQVQISRIEKRILSELKKKLS